MSTLGLGSASVVVDAGAHRGEFSRQLAERFGCQCYLVEANPELADALGREKTFAGVTAAALGVRAGCAPFYVRQNLEASSLLPGGGATVAATNAEVISLRSLVERYDLPRIDVLKLDVEGAEFDVLINAPAEMLTAIGQITVEFHDFQPAFQGRGLYERVRRRLRSLNFACCSTAFRTHGDVLFLNRSRFTIGPAASLGLAVAARWHLRLRAATQ